MFPHYDKGTLMREKLLLLRKIRNRYLFFIDSAYLAIAPLIALMLRLDSFSDILHYVPSLIVFSAIVVPMKLFVAYKAGLYTHYWPYAGEHEMTILLKVTVLTMTAELVLFFGLLSPLNLLPIPMPRSFPIIDGFMTTMMIGGVRVVVKLVSALPLKAGSGVKIRPVLIVGADIPGVMVAKQLKQHPESGLVPIGYLDDDTEKIGRTVYGLPVLGPINALYAVIKERKVAQVVVAMPSAPGRLIREVMLVCKDSNVDSKIVPGVLEIIRGTAKVEQFRSIQLEDLLRRGALKTDARRVASLVKGGCVMVTGAGGSIGSEICRQLREFDPATLILLGHGENSVFAIARELGERKRKDRQIHAIIADVRDRRRMEQIFARHRPSIVFHAAAHKHVALMQDNLADAITNNILGTRNLVDLCERYDVERFVMISSDKAVNPTSVMGVTKRIAELVVMGASQRGRGRFITVRFGNVLGSRGSVIPIFERQISQGGPITVTHPDVRRYFMTIPEAVQLVLQAGTMGHGGEVFVLDMGEQIRIADLARDMLRLHGLKEGVDVEINYTGLVPGEKMYEELFYEGDIVEGTTHEKIMVCRSGQLRPAMIPGQTSAQDFDIQALIEAAKHGDSSAARSFLKKIVPQFSAPWDGNEPPTNFRPVEVSGRG